MESYLPSEVYQSESAIKSRERTNESAAPDVVVAAEGPFVGGSDGGRVLKLRGEGRELISGGEPFICCVCPLPTREIVRTCRPAKVKLKMKLDVLGTGPSMPSHPC